jgi:hypothetical protein
LNLCNFKHFINFDEMPVLGYCMGPDIALQQDQIDWISISSQKINRSDGTLVRGNRSSIKWGAFRYQFGRLEAVLGMITLAMISLLVGMVLGQRFKVLVLLPAIALALVLTVGGGIVRSDSTWWIVLMAATAAATLQVGYVIGVGIRHVLVAAPASRTLANSSSRRPAH